MSYLASLWKAIGYELVEPGLAPTSDQPVDPGLAPTSDQSAIAQLEPRFERFMELPLELREYVYKAAMPSNFIAYTVEVDAYLDPSNHVKFLPKICYTSNAIYIESLVAFLLNARFVFRTWSDTKANWFTSFLNTIPEGRAFKYVTNIQINEYTYKPKLSTRARSAVDPDFWKRLVNLGQVAVQFTNHNLVVVKRKPQPAPRPFARPAHEVARNFDLKGLLDCKALHTVAIEYYEPEKPDPYGEIRSLAARGEMIKFCGWLQKKFSANGQCVTVTLTKMVDVYTHSIYPITRFIDIPAESEFGVGVHQYSGMPFEIHPDSIYEDQR